MADTPSRMEIDDTSIEDTTGVTSGEKKNSPINVSHPENLYKNNNGACQQSDTAAIKTPELPMDSTLVTDRAEPAMNGATTDSADPGKYKYFFTFVKETILIEAPTLSYSVVGLCEEFVEFTMAFMDTDWCGRKNEAGDVLWYITLHMILNPEIKIDFHRNNELFMRDPLEILHKLLKLHLKYEFRGLPREEFNAGTTECLQDMVSLIHSATRMTTRQLMDGSIRKLTKRRAFRSAHE